MSNSVVKTACDIFENGFNKQIILYGPPGTSKTYSATIIAARLLGCNDTSDDGYPSKKAADDYLKGVEKERYKLVQFHPSYSYEDFVRGISVKPVNTTKEQSGENPSNSSSGITYEIEPKIIELFNDRALGDKEKKYVLIIDEINRAPLASVLGELIYGLEYRGETFSTPYSLPEEILFVDDKTPKKDTLKIAKNLYIIGTMNTADRSIGSIDYAVRRRFAFIQVPSNDEAIIPSWSDNTVGKQAHQLYQLLMGEEKIEISDDKIDEITDVILNDQNVIESLGVKSIEKDKAKQAIRSILGESSKSIFDTAYLQDAELDANDIKIGHTYFLGNKRDDSVKAKEKEYLDYRIKYQIRPIYIEYIKDGLLSNDGLMRLDVVVAYWKWKNSHNT